MKESRESSDIFMDQLIDKFLKEMEEESKISV